MLSKNINKKLFVSFLAILWLSSFELPEALSYSQASYYSQSTYYSQASYYSQTYYQATYGVDFSTNVVMNEALYVTGGLSKGAGTFVIDHPLDPRNKLLFHSFVESPDVKNIYDGVVTLDMNGEVIVTLPHYFEALNDDYRYQVKAVTEAAPNLHIKQEIKDNKFVIAGGPPGAMVSWQVTGIRQDPYILANPVIPEVEKGPDQLVDKGEYLFEGYETILRDNWFIRSIDFIKDLFAKLIDRIVFWR